MKHLTYTDRLHIEKMYSKGYPVKEIALVLGYSKQTIYKELKRGAYDRLDGSTWIMERSYSATIAQEDAESRYTSHGAGLKIGSDHAFAAYVENMIRSGLSPDAIVGRLRRTGSPFHTDVCTTTLYSYIHKGVLAVTEKDLPRCGMKKRSPGRPKASRAPAGMSIERRPGQIDARSSYGHWEMDTVVGSQEKGCKETLLVLTERKTCHELMYKMPDKTAASTIRALNHFKRLFKNSFYEIFRSITVDNGPEFAAQIHASKKSPLHNRVPVYYCHPYSAWERGSNENTNILIRRYIPKGTPLEKYSAKQIALIMQRINDMPRKILGYATAAECFQTELRRLSIIS